MESPKSRARKSRGKGSHGDDNDVVDDKEESSINKPSSAVVIFFVRAGLTLPKCRIDILAQRAKNLGAIVVKDFQAPVQKKRKKKKLVWAQQNPHQNTVNRNSTTTNPTPPLTHLVVAKEAQAGPVASVLGFDSVDSLQSYILKHGIECAIPEWIGEAEGTLNSCLKPAERWCWLGISTRKLAASKKRSHESQSGGETKNSQPSSAARLLAPPVPSDDEEETSCSAKTKAFPNNIRLAEAFRELGKLHQKCPLHDQDLWKSYSLDKTAGRIRNLDFEVTLEDESLQRLANMQGIGKSTIGKVREFLTNGEIQRTREFKNDPERVAMRTFMNIWGVGKSTALNLVREGYRTITDVGDGLCKQKILFDRNQCIGFQCYDDFLEEMTRDEVEAIAKIVDEAFRRQFADHSKLEITIMGSYRRGKPKCGDVDVLITHQGWVDTITSETLGEVVDQLFDSGHIAHHLTFIPGMKESQKTGKGTSATYMGVFNSPVEKGKRRRIDIKFYPYRERGFAFLYFTGNGFFNRSMRFYADVQKGLQLSDHGLFDRRTKESVMEARDEREVFEYLGLEYKEPHERNGFDDVVSVGGHKEKESEEITKSAFFGIEAAHTRWID